MQAISILTIFFFILLGNILWYWLKWDLKKKGYKTYYFWGHFGDLTKAAKVISTTTDKKTKRIYTWVLGSLVFALIGMIITFMSFIPSSNNRKCDIYSRILTFNYSGLVSSKYVDSNDHAMEKLILVSGNEESVVYMTHSLETYQFVNTGDFVSKDAGDSTISVRRNKETYKFYIRRTDYCD